MEVGNCLMISWEAYSSGGMHLRVGQGMVACECGIVSHSLPYLEHMNRD